MVIHKVKTYSVYSGLFIYLKIKLVITNTLDTKNPIKVLSQCIWDIVGFLIHGMHAGIVLELIMKLFDLFIPEFSVNVS